MSARGLALVAAAVLALLLPGTGQPLPAHAGCAFGPDSPEAVELAQVIFTGRIISESGTGERHAAVVAVERVYKGEAYAEQRVLAGPTDTGGYRLGVSGPGRVLMLGRYQGAVAPGPLVVGPCSGSRAGNAPASLGPGYPPLPGSTPAAEQPRALEGVSWWVLALLPAGLAAALLVRRRRAPG